MKYRLSIVCLFSFLPLMMHAQSGRQMNAAEIRQGLAGLNVSGSVLYMAAHPDDENTRLLAYLSKEKKLRTGYLSLTRGDGGQNLIGTEQGDLLGLIRTQELLSARKVDGAEQFFSRANDFGFSKTSAETFKVWGKETILSDAVWVIRKFRPDVIITRFPEDARAGHGNHQASAILAREAFDAAADPRRFPEQLRYVKVWQAKRIVWNTFNFGGTNTTASDQLKIDVGAFNPLLGKSYGELAAESRSNHKSQGFGSSAQRGTAMEYFSPVGGATAAKDLFEGIDLSLARYPGSGKAQKLLNQVTAEFDMTDPSKSIPRLLQLRTEVKDIPFKHQQLDELILACAGLWLEASVLEPFYALSDTLPVSVNAVARISDHFPLKVSLQRSEDQRIMPLSPNQPVSFLCQVPASGIGITQPYWLQHPHTIGSYIVDSLSYIGMPEGPAPGIGQLIVRIGDQSIRVSRPIRYQHTDPVKGELFEPLVIGPPVTATMPEKSYVFNNNTPKKITVQLKAFKAGASGILKPEVAAGWKIIPESIEFSLKLKGEEQTVEFLLTPGGQSTGGLITMPVAVAGDSYRMGVQVLEYDHIPVQTLFSPAMARVEKVDLKFSGMNIGYLAGAGDLIPESLGQIGFQVTRLTQKQVMETDLSSFDAIITGVRFYNISEQAATLQPKLMKYVENGGTLLVQYNVDGPLKIGNLGPYPFRLTRERTTEEDAQVIFRAPEDLALNFPNKITSKDFEGWIQERGLYYATDIDSRYTQVLSMHDTGENLHSGSLLTTNYGKGKYVYTSLSFFRELPAGVPGAYRLFVNLIARKTAAR